MTRSPLAWQVATNQEISRCIVSGSIPVRSTTRDDEPQTSASTGSAGSNVVPANTAGRPAASAALRSAALVTACRRGGSVISASLPAAPARAEGAPVGQRPQLGVLGHPAIQIQGRLDVGMPEPTH